jgi:hypothetical protein
VFTPESIAERLHEQRFRPFRIIASEGLRYDIHHPDLVMVGRRDLTVGYAKQTQPMIYDRVVRVAILHIVGIEDLPVTTGAANGPA